MASAIMLLKNNWLIVVAGVLIILAIAMFFMSTKKEKYYDYETTGCSSCSAGDAGVFDYEDEVYQMPDDYYGDEPEDIDAIENSDDDIYEDDTFAGDDAGDNEDTPLAPGMIVGSSCGTVNPNSREACCRRKAGEGVADRWCAENYPELDEDDSDMTGGDEYDIDLLEIDELDDGGDYYSEL